MPKRHTVKPSDYHLIDIVTGESHGGFISLHGARTEARIIDLKAWDIFHYGNRVERHDPDGLAAGGVLAVVDIPPEVPPDTPPP